MRKYLLIILIVVFSIYMFGCGKKEAGIEESQESMSMEVLSVPGMNAAPAAKAPEVTQAAPVLQAQLGPLPPAGPYKPTKQEIQIALKNAGFYSGEIDGKIGPMSKKAIEDFQKANNLQADGKVGLTTWNALSKYLNPEPAPAVPTAAPIKKKR